MSNDADPSDASPQDDPKPTPKQARQAAKRAAQDASGRRMSKKPKRSLLVTVYPEGGGDPYLEEVQVDGQNLFSLKGYGGSYRVARGSVITEGGKRRTNVHTGIPETINIGNMKPDPVMHPMALHGVGLNNYWMQQSKLWQRKSLWRQGSTWAFMLLGMGGLFLLMWAASELSSIANALENLRPALEAAQSAAQDGSTTTGSESGHQDIAPGGR